MDSWFTRCGQWFFEATVTPTPQGWPPVYGRLVGMVATARLPAGLPAAMASVLEGYGVAELRSAVEQLIARYHDPDVSHIVRTTLDAAAYVAYRMPATCAVLGQVMQQYAATDPGFAPRTLVDIGGGTGSAIWATAEQWPCLEKVHVVDESAPMRALGQELALESPHPAVRDATWHLPDSTLNPSDLTTISYLLGELGTAEQAAVVRAAIERTQIIVIVEPGTPLGYRRILAARDLCVEAGLRIAAPCPHGQACPLIDDWCHFAARVSRTSAHRQIKRASLGHEDEKYAYVVASRRPITPAPQRILRHPKQRKGLVELLLCTDPPGTRQRVVTRRDADAFRRAKDAHWGDPWT